MLPVRSLVLFGLAISTTHAMASKAAATTTSAMLRFHSSKTWPFAARVAIALEECGSPYETIAIDLQNKPKDFCDLYALANPLPNARAKVPVLEIVPEGDPEQRVVITESLIVTDYLAESYPDASLIPTSSEDRATMRLFSELCGSSSFSYWSILKARGDKEKFESALEDFKQGLVNANTFLEKKADPRGPFVFGEQFTLAECNTAPFVQRACNALPAFTREGEAIAFVDPLKICEEQGLLRLKTWIEATLARPSVKSIELPEEEMIQSATKMLKRFAAMQTK